MAGQGNLSRLKARYATLSSNSNTSSEWRYHVTTPSTITLPDTATLSIGDCVKFTKKIGVIPTIQRFGSTVLIRTSTGTDTAVFFDIEAEITFVWNGTEWEV